jgi:isoleucyl-tRNA synthetase
LLTYWNTVSFQALYARVAGWTPAETVPALDARAPLDRWLVARTQQLIAAVDGALDGFDAAGAGTEIASFVDDLSNWYVRRSRRRFWDGDPNALQTLHEALTALTLVMAPLTPFITERVWQDLVKSTDPSAPESVHLADWPQVDSNAVDGKLIADVALVKRLVELGRAARAVSGVKTRQPLGRALVSAPAWRELPQQLRDELADELNVQHIELLGAAGDEPVDVTAKANFRSLGKRFGQQTPAVAQAISAADPALLQQSLLLAGRAEVTVGDDVVTIEPDEVVITETPREGWAVHHEGGESLALDLTVTPELRKLGMARDVVRRVQEARKSTGLEVADRIRLAWSATGTLREAITEHADTIAGEVLATEMIEIDEATTPSEGFRDDSTGLTFTITRA